VAGLPTEPLDGHGQETGPRNLPRIMEKIPPHSSKSPNPSTRASPAPSSIPWWTTSNPSSMPLPVGNP